MVVGGVPTPQADHAHAIAALALEMQQEIQRFSTPFGDPIQLRIGLHSGAVVAGVIGTKKFSYDLWGDTVNLASRMESQGMPGRIQITETTHGIIHSQFHCQQRGTIEVKGWGELSTYWLESQL